TAFVCNVADAIARNSSLGVLLFSLEQSTLELAERFLAISSRVNGHDLRAGNLSEEQHDRLVRASDELSRLPLFIDDKPGRTMTEVAAVSRRLHRRSPLGVIIIDYLQLIEPEDKHTPREQQIAQISRRLKFLAKELRVPVIALSQLNRGVELREDKRPRLADLRESGAIEQDADMVMFLHRPDAYDPEDRPGEAEIVVAKHRSGPTGIVRLTWRKEYMRFENYSPMTDDDFNL
ncbi:MAG: DnaB-like helicase C-terminal domain-containing protein, partial [Planctomycetaceae bacterium]|nr:DnaB-like helicase C-terminal domain-containing protein [Planctomycetaceae bacterium]